MKTPLVSGILSSMAFSPGGEMPFFCFFDSYL